MFHDDMRLNSRLRISIALLLAWMLPLQGTWAMSGCAGFDPAKATSQNLVEQHSVAAGAKSPAATQHEHCKHASGTPLQHHCGANCCAAAIATARVLWVAPRSPAPAISVAVIWPSPTVEFERLDRPPRSV
jgi:hypothetical protein